jgi:hypothetical protein
MIRRGIEEGKSGAETVLMCALEIEAESGAD